MAGNNQLTGDEVEVFSSLQDRIPDGGDEDENGLVQLEYKPAEWIAHSLGWAQSRVDKSLTKLRRLDLYDVKRTGRTNYTWWARPLPSRQSTPDTGTGGSLEKPTAQMRLTSLVDQANTALSMLGTALTGISTLAGEILADVSELEELHTVVEELRDEVAQHEQRREKLRAALMD